MPCGVAGSSAERFCNRAAQARRGLAVPSKRRLRALGLPYEVRGSGATARNEVVRFLVGYLESLRKPDDPDAFEGAAVVEPRRRRGADPQQTARSRARARPAADTGRAPPDVRARGP